VEGEDEAVGAGEPDAVATADAMEPAASRSSEALSRVRGRLVLTC
jgi:hypothetical protein